MATKKKKIVTEEEKSTKEQGIDRIDAPEESETDQEIDLETAETETGTAELSAPEVLAVNEDTDAALEMDEQSKSQKVKKSESQKPKAKKARPAKAKKSVRSKAYLAKTEEIQISKKYSLEEAVSTVKKTSYGKFDATLTLSLHVEKAKKGDDQIRGTIKLPNGTGKKMKVEIATDELIEKIKKGYSEFDILVASPAEMGKLGQVAKILGPKGKMPNPKDGTVVDDPKAHIEDLGEKIARYRSDLGRNIHVPVGKVSWDDARIIENIQAVLKALLKYKKISITLAPTMGRAVRIEAK